MTDGSTWVDDGGTCPKCHYPGKHLQVDGQIIYCGRCRAPLQGKDD